MGEIIDKVKGKAKQVEGKVTGNKARQAEGIADEMKGKAKGKFEELKTDIKRAARKEDDSEEQTLRPGDAGEAHRNSGARP
jgi:uncharacterized protein YjbJ (UPF0337 family)